MRVRLRERVSVRVRVGGRVSVRDSVKFRVRYTDALLGDSGSEGKSRDRKEPG